MPLPLRRPNPHYGNAIPIDPADVPARLGHRYDEVVRLTEAHTLAVQRWLPALAPQVNRFEGRGTTAVANGMPARLFNQALGASYSGVSEAEIEAEIAAVIGFLTARSPRWLWWLGPSTYPPDFPARLERRGLVCARDLPAMVAPLPLDPLPATAPNLEVWQARTCADLAAASLIRRAAFHFAPGAGETYFEDAADDWLAGDPARLYLVRESGGPPAAIGALIVAEGVPGIYVMATLPEYERRGMGLAVLVRMMVDAAQEGHDLLVLTASPKGFGLYRKVGFEYLFDFHLYHLPEM